MAQVNVFEILKNVQNVHNRFKIAAEFRMLGLISLIRA